MRKIPSFLSETILKCIALPGLWLVFTYYTSPAPDVDILLVAARGLFLEVAAIAGGSDPGEDRREPLLMAGFFWVWAIVQDVLWYRSQPTLFEDSDRLLKAIVFYVLWLVNFLLVRCPRSFI